MLKWFLKKLGRKKPAESTTAKTVDVGNPGGKTKSLKILVLSVLVFLSLGGLGFVGFFLVGAPLINANKKILPAHQPISNIAPASSLGDNAWLAGQVPQPPSQQSVAPKAVLNQIATQKVTVVTPPVIPTPVQTIEKKGQEARIDVKAVKDDTRNVFKEFYIDHPLAGQSISKAKEKTLDKALDKALAGAGTVGGGFSTLPAGTIINTTAKEPLKVVKIYGITCADSNDCIAITSEGTLKRGDKIGGETVSDVTKTSLVTDNRVVEYR